MLGIARAVEWVMQTHRRWESRDLCFLGVLDTDVAVWDHLDGKLLFFFWYSQGPASMMAYLIISGFFLTRLRRPIGKMTIIEQKYEGEYRYVNSRLITNRYSFTWMARNKWEKNKCGVNGSCMLKYIWRVWCYQFWAKFASLYKL